MYPLVELLSDDHNCETSCYRCLQRYGNQPLHALLDWQLGMTFLRCLVDPTFRCGLDGDFSFYGLRKWPGMAAMLAGTMGERFEGGATAGFEGVPAFRIGIGRGQRSPWILVGHPFWDWQDEMGTDGILAAAREAAQEFGEPLCWDSFNLLRRQVFVRERIKQELRDRA